MDVIDMPDEITLIADCMFPVPPLPEREFTIRVARERGAGGEQVGTEMPFDASPPACEIGVSWRQGPERMKVIRQDHDRINRERARLPGRAKRSTQGAGVIDESRGSAISQRHGEEECSTLDAVPPISDHSDIIPENSLRSSAL
jgi:hypothetical protein